MIKAFFIAVLILLGAIPALASESLYYQRAERTLKKLGPALGAPPAWLMGKHKVGYVYHSGGFDLYCVYAPGKRKDENYCVALLYRKAGPLSPMEVRELMKLNISSVLWKRITDNEWSAPEKLVKVYRSKDHTALLLISPTHLAEIGGYDDARVMALPVPVPPKITATKRADASIPGERPPPSEESKANDPESRERESLLAFLKEAGLVTRRTPVFAAVLEEGANDPAQPHFGENFQKGYELGHLRAGFLLKYHRSEPNSGVLATSPVPLAGVNNVCVYFTQPLAFPVRTYGRSTEETVTKRFSFQGLKPYVLTKGTELLGPMEPSETILYNGKGAMDSACVVVPEQREGNAVLGVVKTQAGYFLGYLRERDSLQSGKYTWAQVCGLKTESYRLIAKNSLNIKKNTRVVRLAATEKTRRRATMISDPGQAQIRPAVYDRLLQLGMNGVLLELEAPSDAGFEERPVENETGKNQGPGYVAFKQSTLEEIHLVFQQWTEGETIVEIEEKRSERKVETWLNGCAVVKTSLGPLRSVKVRKLHSVQNDLDGGYRFTDGESIYEIAPSQWGARLTTYEVQENAFVRKK